MSLEPVARKEPPHRLAAEGVVVTATGRSDVLTRLPSRKGADKAPVELVDFARDAIERGALVRVRRTRPRLLLRVLAGLAVFAGGTYVLSLGTTGFPGVATALLAMAGLGYVVVVALLPPRYGGRLVGRPVAGANRASTELWRTAVSQVSAGTRAEADLPELHRQLVEVANAEDRVSRLARRTRYDLDQSETQTARYELDALVARARRSLGEDVPETAAQPYLASRWSEAAGIEQPEPADPRDLR